MKFRRFQLALLASALGGAVGVASAQAVSPGTDAAALTQEAAVSSNTTAGSPGTQSGVAVSDTTTMGAPASSYSSSYSVASLSRTQTRLLQRHNALR